MSPYVVITATTFVKNSFLEVFNIVLGLPSLYFILNSQYTINFRKLQRTVIKNFGRRMRICYYSEGMERADRAADPLTLLLEECGLPVNRMTDIRRTFNQQVEDVEPSKAGLCKWVTGSDICRAASVYVEKSLPSLYAQRHAVYMNRHVVYITETAIASLSFGMIALLL